MAKSRARRLLQMMSGLFNRQPPKRLLLNEVRGASAARVAESIILSRLSKSGTDIAYGAISSEETNSNFSTVGSWAAKAKEMKRTDTRAAALDMIVRHMLRAPTYKATAPSDSFEAIRNADFVNEALGWNGCNSRMERSWEEVLASVANYAGIGYWVVEEVYKYEDGLIWLGDLVDVEPNSVSGWYPDAAGNLQYITQWPMGQGEPSPIPLPAEKALIFTNQRTGRNYEGVGLLRPCLDWYDLKMLCINMTGIGIQKWAIPTPMLEVNRNATLDNGYTVDDVNLMIERQFANLQNFQAGETEVMTTTPVVGVSTYGDGKVNYIPAIIQLLQHANREMASAYMAVWLDLGVQNTGSRAVGQVHYDAAISLYRELADQVVQTFDGRTRPGGGVVDRLLKMNFYGDTEIPESERPVLGHTGIKARALADALSMLPALVSAGLLDADVSVKDAVRQLLEVADLEDAAVAEDVAAVDDNSEPVLPTNTGEEGE